MTKGEFVRRVFLLLTAMVVAMVLGSGIALAAAISGTQGDDTLRGTEQNDQIYGLNGEDNVSDLAGDDQLYGGAGPDDLIGSTGKDELYGGSGLDSISGGPGADFINSADNDFDRVNCGGRDGASDEVARDREDRVVGCKPSDNVRPPTD